MPMVFHIGRGLWRWAYAEADSLEAVTFIRSTGHIIHLVHL
jgi:hypothetical protein